MDCEWYKIPMNYGYKFLYINRSSFNYDKAKKNN